MRAAVATIALAVPLSLAAPPAVADPAEAAALVHLDRGVAAFRAADYALARREFAAASELAPDRPNPYRWLALTEVQLGDCPGAAAHADRFLSLVGPDDPRAAELVRLRDLCRRTGALRVDTTPPRASLRIDDALVGRTPYRSLSMRPGSHRLVAEAPGHEPAERSVVVQAGREVEVHLQLDRRARPIARRWWFWAVVVGAAAAATAAIAIAADDPADRILPPIRCDERGCEPGMP